MTEILKTATLIPYWIAPKATTHLIRKQSFHPDRRNPQGLAREIEAMADHSRFEYKGQSIQVYHWEGAGPTIYLAHGWSSRALRFNKLIHCLVTAGFNVIAIDGVGHGRSTGHYSSYPEYVDLTTEFLGTLTTPPDFLLGHSMGGSAVSRAAFELNLNSDLILVAPMFSFDRELKKFEKTLPIHPRVYNGMIQKILRENGRETNAISLDSVCDQLSNRALLIHDKTDRITLAEDTVEAHSTWDESEILITQGLGHSKLLDDPKVVQKVLNFINAEVDVD